MKFQEVEKNSNWAKILEIIKNPRYLDENDMELNDLAEYIGELLSLEHYDHGVGRVCCGFGDKKIIKIATSLRGVQDNFKEQELWNSLPESLQCRFAKCYESGYGWAVFEYIEGFISFTNAHEYVDEANKIIKELESNGICLKDIGIETLYKNWGLKDNQLIIFDYAT